MDKVVGVAAEHTKSRAANEMTKSDTMKVFLANLLRNLA
jgi:hypothetical protein